MLLRNAEAFCSAENVFNHVNHYQWKCSLVDAAQYNCNKLIIVKVLAYVKYSVKPQTVILFLELQNQITISFVIQRASLKHITYIHYLDEKSIKLTYIFKKVRC